MEEFVAQGGKYGIIGLGFMALLAFLYKMITYVTKKSLESDKELVKAQNELAKNTLKLSDNVDKGGQLIMLKMQSIHKGLGEVSAQLKDIATRDEVLSNHRDIIKHIDTMKKELKILIQNK